MTLTFLAAGDDPCHMIRGFTLVELIAVILVLAVLAGVAIPRFIDHSDRARQAAVQQTLDRVRSGITQFKLERSAAGQDQRWPTIAELMTPGLVIAGPFPANPYRVLLHPQNTVSIQDSTTEGVGFTEDDDDWNYCTATGRFWANTTTVGEHLW